MKPILILAAAATLAAAADNALTPAEAKAGWRLLFDGTSMNGWRDPAKKDPPGDSWAIQDGCLTTRLKPRIAEDLISAESYGDFELVFDWRISPGGNTGVKYRIQDTVFVDNTKINSGPGGFEGMLGREMATRLSDRAKLAPQATAQEYTIGFEMQLLDDARHPDAKLGHDGDRTLGSLYDLIPAPKDKKVSPMGEWNHARVLAQGKHVEFWLNGVKTVEFERGSARFRELVAASKYKSIPDFGEWKDGHILLQEHGNEVWFRNVKIRELGAR